MAILQEEILQRIFSGEKRNDVELAEIAVQALDELIQGIYDRNNQNDQNNNGFDEKYEFLRYFCMQYMRSPKVYYAQVANLENIKKMKDGVILVNTSRGALVDTNELIEGIRLNKFLGVGLDVYEEETGNVYEDRSDDIMMHSVTARLLAFPNVIITSHQGFYTMEALAAIADTTLQNVMDAKNNIRTENDVA